MTYSGSHALLMAFLMIPEAAVMAFWAKCAQLQYPCGFHADGISELQSPREAKDESTFLWTGQRSVLAFIFEEGVQVFWWENEVALKPDSMDGVKRNSACGKTGAYRSRTEGADYL